MPNVEGSKESLKERADRQYEELLQELRVAQAGVQILFAFLLVLPFQSGFTRLPGDLKSLYAVSLLASLVAAALLIGPVALHRILSGEQMKDTIVDRAHRAGAFRIAVVPLAFGHTPPFRRRYRK